MRIALAQVNATVGDLAGNSELIVDWTRRAAEQGARLVVFPEMMLTGYPVEDLALRASFVDASIAALQATAERLAAEGLGGDRRGDRVPGPQDRDAAAGRAARRARRSTPPRCCMTARSRCRSAKHHLPNYGVFDEYRYFVPGDVLPVVRMRADDGDLVDVAIAICEDLWQDGGPVAVTCTAGAGLLVVPNASPYERGKDDTRLELCQRRSREAGATLAYVNMVGGQDELVFDGDSIIVDAAGELLARGPQFEEALVVADLELPAAAPRRARRDTPVDARDGTMITVRRLGAARPARPRRRTLPGPRTIWPRLPDPAEVYAALVTGVHDYVGKNGFGSVILALSGGIDSALTATIAADAIGPDRVHVVLMPSRYSSDHSVTDAEDLAKRQGLHARTVPIRLHGRRVRGGARPDRPGRGEPAGQDPRHDPDVAVQRRGPPGPHHRQQERAGHRLLHPLRRLGRRLRADQGRAEDAGLGAGPVAQPPGGEPRRDAADPGELDHQAAERRAGARAAGHRLAAGLRGARPAAATTTWSTTWAPRSWSRPATTRSWWTG